MKKFLRRIVMGWLANCAKCRISQSKATVIGVTGSVGKTTTKDALALVLSTRFTVLANKKSFNSEFGLPLTLLEESSAVRPLDWFGIAWNAWRKRNTPITADYIILEMGTDSPGDMDYLLSIIRPRVGIFTKVAPVHLGEGQFDSLEEIAHEKGKLITSLPADGFAILNHNDELVWQFAGKTNAGVAGFGAGGEYAPENLQMTHEGMQFTIQNQKYSVPVVGRHHAELFSAVCATTLKLGFQPAEIAEALSKFHLEPGRMSILEGINDSTLIDGSYNSNPSSARAGIDALAEFSGRRVAVLGQMNELGNQSERYHRFLGEYLRGKADFLVGVYGDAKYICESFDATGTKMKFFENSVVAGEFLQTFLKKDDTALFKGSQNNVRLEKAVEMVMLHPERASELLCRQGQEWKD